jgi:hypothetical protein
MNRARGLLLGLVACIYSNMAQAQVGLEYELSFSWVEPSSYITNEGVNVYSYTYFDPYYVFGIERITDNGISTNLGAYDTNVSTTANIQGITEFDTENGEGYTYQIYFSGGPNTMRYGDCCYFQVDIETSWVEFGGDGQHISFAELAVTNDTFNLIEGRGLYNATWSVTLPGIGAPDSLADVNTYLSQYSNYRLTGGEVHFQLMSVPVPEPETYAMFLAGLGIVGAVVRRRRKR